MLEEIPPEIRRVVLRRINDVEKDSDVKVVYACESGSRAWGFSSKDSDYDVRFIYVNRPDWYLSVDKRRDVIELPIEGDLDINGWDLKKALVLLRKSNPPLLEWLGSPIVYRETTPIARWMRDFVRQHYSAKACWHHYFHMAEGNFRHYLKGAEVLRKKYLYVLRPVVAILWIERGLGVVPTLFQTAIDAVIDDPVVKTAIDGLLAEKRAGTETDRGLRIEEISEFLETELDRLANLRSDSPGANPPWEALNKLFRDSITVAWQPEA